MATETSLTRIHVFPSESSYNTNKSQVTSTELSLVKMSGNFLEGNISQIGNLTVTEGRDSSYDGFGKMWTWYRVYESGWVIQGGHFEREPGTGNSPHIVTLPVPFREDYMYTVLATKSYNSSEGNCPSYDDTECIGGKTQTNFSYRCGSTSDATTMPIDWIAFGYKR